MKSLELTDEELHVLQRAIRMVFSLEQTQEQKQVARALEIIKEKIDAL